MALQLQLGAVVSLAAADGGDINKVEGVVGDIGDFEGAPSTVTVLFPASAARTVPVDQVAMVADDAPSTLRSFVAALRAAVRPQLAATSRVLSAHAPVADTARFAHARRRRPWSRPHRPRRNLRWSLRWKRC